MDTTKEGVEASITYARWEPEKPFFQPWKESTLYNSSSTLPLKICQTHKHTCARTHTYTQTHTHHHHHITPWPNTHTCALALTHTHTHTHTHTLKCTCTPACGFTSQAKTAHIIRNTIALIKERAIRSFLDYPLQIKAQLSKSSQGGSLHGILCWWKQLNWKI